ANGVILITTKSGQARQGIGVEFNSSFTFENPLAIPEWQYEYGSGSGGIAPGDKAAAVSNGRTSWGAKLDGSMVINPDGVARPYVAQKNNIKNFYDTGTTFSNTLAISGGNETANFRFSVSNTDVNAIVPNSSTNRKTFNLSTNANLSKKIVFEGKAQYNVESNKNRTAIADFTGNPNAAIGLMATNIDVRTLAPGYDESGNEMAWSDYNFVSNPYFAASKRKNEDLWQRFLGSFSLRYNILDFLYLRARLGTDYTNIEGFNITPTGTLHSAPGSMTESKRKFYENNAEILLGFDKKIGDFSVNMIAGGNQMYKNNIRSNFSSGDLNVPFIYFISNGKTPTFSQTFSELQINSLFASADIGFRNYLYLTLTGREDWFSTLTDPDMASNNSLFYPSAGLSYVISETWQTRPNWLSYVKARASWAQVGGGAPDAYRTRQIFTAPTSSHLGQALMYIEGNTIPNMLAPYTSTTMEAGLDLRLFNNRIGIDFTIYDRTTTKDIVDASVPPSTSYNNVSMNVGEVKNRGVELMLTGTPVSTNTGFNWDVVFNMAYNKNTVVKIADDLPSLSIATARTGNGFVYHYEGQPFGMVSGYKMKQDASGRIVYNSANGIPVQSEFMSLGRGVPPMNISLTNNFSYRNFTFSFLLDSKFGGVMYSASNAYGTNYGLHKNTVANGVRETGVSVSGVDQNGNPYNAVVDAETYFEGIAFSITDEYVYKADFIKLRQFNLGYSLPKVFLDKTPFQSANISFVARNLFLIYSAMENVDPESNYSTANGQGLENFGVPPTRSYGFNLSVRF
ncbi:MAG: SusC/RagA family TonB-linked outer membrane protein, partial [Bacteroidales bacterium]|nr:SusC/RagA family TonB-linked outer membrane protein [Bacteroidales bacterium]